jgi:uncharacterized protein (TIGR03086 family)
MQESPLLAQAAALFGSHLAAVKAGQWASPTPASQWDVRALVRHVTEEFLWVPPLLAGQTIAEVGDQFTGDILGSNPLSAWEAAARSATNAVQNLPSADQIVHLSFGDVPARTYVQQLLIDTVIHGWDLARSISANDAIPPNLLQAAQRLLEPQAEDWRQAGLLGPRLPVAADASEQTKLLALAGRKA